MLLASCPAPTGKLAFSWFSRYSAGIGTNSSFNDANLSAPQNHLFSTSPRKFNHVAVSLHRVCCLFLSRARYLLFFFPSSFQSYTEVLYMSSLSPLSSSLFFFCICVSISIFISHYTSIARFFTSSWLTTALPLSTRRLRKRPEDYSTLLYLSSPLHLLFTSSSTSSSSFSSLLVLLLFLYLHHLFTRRRRRRRRR